MFQHTATRRWLPALFALHHRHDKVSTHSHPKVAACGDCLFARCIKSFNTQPPEGGCADKFSEFSHASLFQHTATRRWLLLSVERKKLEKTMFQHTATRRWLPVLNAGMKIAVLVSTHSHPKVAAPHKSLDKPFSPCFNTQPPEGGCLKWSGI